MELQSFATAAQSETSFGVADKMNVYRLYNPRNGEHLYTRDLYEAKTIASEQGWQWEGVGFTASSTTGQAVWRLYERASGLHLWTTDANERRVLLAGRKGWDDEGLAWYGAGPYRLSRLYDPASGQHLYTRDANEVSLLTGQRGWRLEDGAGTWDTGSASDYVPVEPQWLVSDSWGVAGGRYWIQADGSIAHDRYLAPAEGTGYGYNVYATSTGAMLRDDATRIDGVLTAANKDGRLIPITSSISLNVPYTNQYDEGAPMGCEGAGLYMALRAKGYIPNMTYRQFMGTMPYAPDGNPYHGFIGSPWPGYDPYEYNGMLMGGVAKWGARYAPVEDLTGCGEGTLVAELAQGNPLVVWVRLHVARDDAHGLQPHHARVPGVRPRQQQAPVLGGLEYLHAGLGGSARRGCCEVACVRLAVGPPHPGPGWGGFVLWRIHFRIAPGTHPTYNDGVA